MFTQIIRRAAVLVLVASPLALPLPAQQTRAITFEDFSAMRGVSDPQLSPDGKTVLYAVRTTDVAANKRATRTFAVSTAGGAPRAWPDDRTGAAEARWSPDGAKVAFTSGGQLWIADASGANARAITSLSSGASGPVWSPTGDRLAFTSGVYPSCADDACNAAKAKTASESKVKAHVADQLMYRHWNAWDDATRSHVFVVKPDGGDVRDLVPGATYDVPPGPFGGSEGYAFSPDGKELAFTAKAQGRADAWTTDLNIYTVSVAGGTAAPVTAANKGADQNPVYTPDGKYIIYASQKKGGFESDKWRLMAYDRGAKSSRDLLPTWDRWAESYVVMPDSRAILVGGGDRGRDKFFRVPLDASGKAGAPALAMGEHNNTAASVAHDGKTIAWVRDATERPAEVWMGTLGANGAVDGAHALTHENDALVAKLTLYGAEDFGYMGAAGDSVFGFIVKPPQWKAGQKFPLLLLIHGGPQGAWLDAWGSRWAPQMFAQGGYGLVIINPHGSTGYGQKFTDAVSKDWGGKTYDDLMKGVDAALAKYPWLDSTRMAAAGGSYGGYMVNWIGGHTNRFKALVSHAGVFNLEAMAGATEEQWFVDSEFGGMWTSPANMAEQYRKYSPHLFVKNFKTPTLIIGGELDYRIPYSEGLSLFTALQRQGVASRLLVFPDEGHWVLKPQNSQLWWSEVHKWIGGQVNPKPSM